MRMRNSRPDFLDPAKVRAFEQFWFSDFLGWNLVIECDQRGDEPPYIVSVLSHGQYDTWERVPFNVLPKFFYDALEEAVDYAWLHGYEDFDDYLANRADIEYGDRA